MSWVLAGVSLPEHPQSTCPLLVVQAPYNMAAELKGQMCCNRTRTESSKLVSILVLGTISVPLSYVCMEVVIKILL